ncbi:hypothetical protein VTO42DRAFT_4562 [Malbranchea cinnamomea]
MIPISVQISQISVVRCSVVTFWNGACTANCVSQPVFRRNQGQVSVSVNCQNGGLGPCQSLRPSARIGICASSIQEPRLDSPLQEHIGPDDDLCRVVMAIDVKERGTFGCCYYVAEEEKLYILEDIEQGGMDIIETIKLEIEPTVVVVSTRADQVPPVHSKNGGRNAMESDVQFQLPYHVDVRPCQEFSVEGAKVKLSSLNIHTASDDISRFLVPADSFSHEHEDERDLGYTECQARLLRLASAVDMENRVSIGCAGALLTYLQRKRSARYLQDNHSRDDFCMVKAITMLTTRGKMFINKDTLSSLQIIQSESHPNTFNQGPGKASHGAKESLSIYGLFQRFARTPQGKALLRQHFICPSTDLKVIIERHDFISTFLRPENDAVLNKMIKSLRGIKNLRPVLIHLRKGISSGNAKFKGFKSVVWANLLEFAFHAIDVHQSLREVKGGESLVLCSKALLKLDLPQLLQVGKAIHETVDLQSSLEEHRTVIKPRVDQELDRLKEIYNGMDSLLDRVAIDIAATLPDGLECQVNVIYFPQLGFNIAMPMDETGRALYDGGDEPWDRVFTTENRIYFKDSRMREMDENLGDIYGQICGR